MIIGYIALGLIMIAFFILNTKYYKLFIPIDCIATLLFLIHALQINDIPFIVMNGFLLLMLLWKWNKGGLK